MLLPLEGDRGWNIQPPGLLSLVPGLLEFHFVNSERLRELFLSTLNPTDYAACLAFPRRLNHLSLPCLAIVRERHIRLFVLQEVEIVDCRDAEMIHVRFPLGRVRDRNILSRSVELT